MMPREHVGIAILAAGGSHRMGRLKQLLPFRERTLARHAVETAVASRCRPIVVAIGAKAELIRDELQRLPVLIVHNREWASGIRSSLRPAIETCGAFESIEGLVLALSVSRS